MSKKVCAFCDMDLESSLIDLEIDGSIFTLCNKHKHDLDLGILGVIDGKIQVTNVISEEEQLKVTHGVKEIISFPDYTTRYNEVIKQRQLITNTETTFLDTLKSHIEVSKKVYINVSFVRETGLKLLLPILLSAKENGCEVVIITSTYMSITEPNALFLLNEHFEVHLYNKKNSFHPKSYIFELQSGEVIATVGSSNISYSALVSGVEWNYFVREETSIFIDAFKSLLNSTTKLTFEMIEEYAKSFNVIPVYKNFDSVRSIETTKIEPRGFQVQALANLKKTRELGNNKALVVAATGLGKTYLSVFDTVGFNKILFISHRDEILKKTQESYFKYYGQSKSYGFFNGESKDVEADIIFASIQTINKSRYLNEDYFKSDYFDYIVIDEFHHASANTYTNTINYFNPKFLLGITATPDRMDGGDILKLCNYNLVYNCGLKEGIDKTWLVPFEYFGVYDKTDYAAISYNNGKYSDIELLKHWQIDEHMYFILDKYKYYHINQTLAFCINTEHAIKMCEFFNSNGIKSSYILGSNVKDRSRIIKDFKEGKIQVIFSVDVLNEGVDIPIIETVLFLRPTMSSTIFTQQLGRGLRTNNDKSKLRVIDFIGNYKDNTNFISILSGVSKEKLVQEKIINLEMPAGCHMNLDIQLIELFEKQNAEKRRIKNLTSPDILAKEEFNFLTNYNIENTLVNLFTYSKFTLEEWKNKTFRQTMFITLLEDRNIELNNFESTILNNILHTGMQKIYKVPILYSFIKDDKLLKESSVDRMVNCALSFYENKENVKFTTISECHKFINRPSFSNPVIKQPHKALLNSCKEFFEEVDDKIVIKDEFYDNIKHKEFINLYVDIVELKRIIFMGEGTKL